LLAVFIVRKAIRGGRSLSLIEGVKNQRVCPALRSLKPITDDTDELEMTMVTDADETAEQLQFVSSLGSTALQGWTFDRPPVRVR